MATGASPASNFFVPEVVGPLLASEFVGKVKLLANGGVMVDTSLVGNPGDTVNFPKFATLTDAAAVADGSSLTAEQLTSSAAAAEIIRAGKAVELTDKAILTAVGDPMGETIRQLATVIARKVDTDLKTAAEDAGALTHDGSAAAISADAIADALGKFGDAEVDEFAGIFIHSHQKTALFKDDDFRSADKAGQSVLATGAIGDVFGVPVFVSDRMTVNDLTTDTYQALVVKKNALALAYKTLPEIETDRDILKGSTVAAVWLHYAVKRINDSGICVLTTI